MRSPDPRQLGDPRAAAQAILQGPAAGKEPLANWREWFPEIIGRSGAMLRVLETVSKVARSDSSVLILGESGTGKELIAAALHRLSPRSHKAYVPLNTSAIPENLLESELFGHERGAFTGADKRKVGKFEYAEGGSLFLDEIGDMPPMLQAKLLRVLQDKKYVLIGSNQMRDADVRVIAATNMNLESAMRDGTFRADLFYRLNVLPILLPPLRERTEDIPALLEHFIEMNNRMHSAVPSSHLTDGLVRWLSAYHWPGNIRQLENLVQRLVVLKGGGAIDVGDLPPEMLVQEARYALAQASLPPPHDMFALPDSRGPRRLPSSSSAASMPLPRPLSAGVHLPEAFGTLPEDGLDLTQFIEDLENDLIRQALERTGNNRNQAAKLLGLNRTTLVERIKKRRLTTLNEPSKEL